MTRLPLCFLVLVAACDGSERVHGAAIAGGSGGSSGATGATAAQATAASVAGVGGGCNPAGPAAESAASAGGGMSCSNDTHATGSLGGMPVDFGLSRQEAFLAPLEGQASVRFCGRGALLAVADGQLPSDVATPVTAWFRAPTGNVDEGVWYCAGAGSSETVGSAALDVTLSSLRRLGRCPGAPLAGHADVCMSPANGQCDGDDSYVRAPLACGGFDWEDPMRGGGAVFGSEGFFVTALVGVAQGGAMTLDLTDNGAIDGGLLVLPESQGGGAYCVGDGTFDVNPNTAVYRFTLTGLSWLGSCASAPAVSGQLHIQAM